MSVLRIVRSIAPAAVLVLPLAACDGPTDLGPDTRTPSIVSVGPDSAVLTRVGDSITFSGVAEDDRSIERVSYTFWDAERGSSVEDEATLGSHGTYVPFTATFTPPRDGKYTIYFVPEDGAGNLSAEGDLAQLTLFADRTPPDVVVTDPDPALTAWRDSVLTLQVVATDSVQISDVRYSVNGSPFERAWPLYGVAHEDPSIEVALEPGPNTVVVQAVDMVGRVAETIHVYDRVAPRPARFSEIEGTAANWCGRTADGGWLCSGEEGVTLGVGTAFPVGVPAPMLFEGEMETVDVGDAHACGIAAGGVPHCWGAAFYGHLGTAQTPGSGVTLAPRRATESLLLASVRVATHVTCGVAPDGSGWCWGYDADGALGGGDAEVPPACYHSQRCTSTPVRVDAPVALREISPGGDVTCGLATDATAWCWGTDRVGSLGDGPDDSTGPYPVAVSGGLAFRSLDVSSRTACGVTTAGAAYCWGSNGSGQVGDGTEADRDVPTAVATSLTWKSVGFAEHDLPCGLATDGTVHCWGDGSTSLTPLAGGLVFTQVSRSHGCGIATDGGVYCWDASLDPVRVGDAI